MTKLNNNEMKSLARETTELSEAEISGLFCPEKILSQVTAAFPNTETTPPTISLRAANQIDEYRMPTAYNDQIDQINDRYLEENRWGIAHLDPPAFQYYLPHLIDYSLRNYRSDTPVIEDILWNLLPPDRDPPRFSNLAPMQKELVLTWLEFLAFSEGSTNTDLACKVLEEWWKVGG